MVFPHRQSVFRRLGFLGQGFCPFRGLRLLGDCRLDYFRRGYLHLDYFLRGYGEERAYTQEMEALRPLMGRFVDLLGYARVYRSLTSRPALEPDWLVNLRAKLELHLREIRRRVCGAESDPGSR